MLLSLQLGNARVDVVFPPGVRLEPIAAFVRDIPRGVLPTFEAEVHLESITDAPEIETTAGARRQRPRVIRDGTIFRVFTHLPFGPARCDDLPVRALIPALLEVLARHGVSALHASAVTHRGGALLFAGRSGSGKSTSAHECTRLGCNFLADDRVLVWQSGGSILVTPSFERPNPFTRWAGIRPEIDSPPPPRRESALGVSAPLARIFLPRVRPESPSAIEPASPGAVHAELSACTWAEWPPLPSSIPAAYLTLGLHAGTFFSRLLED